MYSRRLWTGFFLLFFFTCLIWFNVNKPRIMILHSYNTDFAWVRDINKGIQRVLDGKPYLLRYYYLDTKRNTDEEYKLRAGAACVREIRKWKPDIIISVDDNAQEYVCKQFNNDPSITIIFTGVNAEAPKYYPPNTPNVTGVLERIPYDAVKESFTFINPKGRFVHICDSSETSGYIQEELETFNWKPLTLVETVKCETLEKWLETVRRANAEADFLLITHYHTIKGTDGRTMRPKEVIDATKRIAKIPLVGCWDFFVEDGGMLAVAVSPFEQGEIPAKMGVEIIERGKKVLDIPIVKSNQFTISMRPNELKKFQIKIPMIFEAFARGLNHYYE